jgi:hypothetical protein
LSTAPVSTAPSVVQSPPATPVTAAPTLPAPGTVEPTAAASRAEPAPVQSIPEPSLAAPISPLSSADTVIRSREREDECPTISPASFNVSGSPDKPDQLPAYEKRQAEILELFLKTAAALIKGKPEAAEDRGDVPGAALQVAPPAVSTGADYVIPEPGRETVASAREIGSPLPVRSEDQRTTAVLVRQVSYSPTSTAPATAPTLPQITPPQTRTPEIETGS